MQAVALVLAAAMLAGDIDWDEFSPQPTPARIPTDAAEPPREKRFPQSQDPFPAAIAPVQFQPDPSFALQGPQDPPIDENPTFRAANAMDGEETGDWIRPNAPHAGPSFLPVPREGTAAPVAEPVLVTPLRTAPTPISETPVVESPPAADFRPAADHALATRSAVPNPEPRGTPELPATVPAASPRASTPSQPRFTFDDLQEPAGQDRHPGGPHFLTLLALFGSVGLNVYLGWIAWDTYNRYQDLVADMRRGAQRVREGRRTAKPAT